jgi:hypothetical protein
MTTALKLSDIGGVTADPSGLRHPTAHEVWTTLSAVNVNKQIKKKGGLSYLSWPYAYGQMMEHFPDFHYIFLDNEIHGDGCITTHVACFIGDIKREMWLPCMDNRNNAIKSPDGRDISDTKMRCLVKCISMFGLGHYIYAGEDLPSDGPAVVPDVPKELTEEEKDKLAAVALTLRTFIEDVADRDALKAYWKDNKKALLELQQGNQDLYDGVLKLFKAQGKKIAEATEG